MPSVGKTLEIGVDLPGDRHVDGPDAQLLDDRLAVAASFFAGSPIRHGHGQDVFRPQRPGGQRGDHARVDAAGQSDHGAAEPRAANLAADEAGEDRGDQLRIDRQIDFHGLRIHSVAV